MSFIWLRKRPFFLSYHKQLWLESVNIDLYLLLLVTGLCSQLIQKAKKQIYLDTDCS